MKIGTSSTFNLRSVVTLGQRRAPQSAESEDSTVADNPLAKQIKDWQNAQSQLKALAALRSGPKQAALEKAAMLRQRLEMLKAMLQFATPGMAKALAQELKNIASQLGSLGQSVGSSSSGTTVAASVSTDPNARATIVTAPSSTITTASAATTTAAISPPDGGSTANASRTDAEGAATSTADEADSAPTTPEPSSVDTDDNALRKTLQDLRKLLQEVIPRVKALMREGDKESKRDLKSAEDSLAALDKALSQGDGNSLYTAQGNFSAAFTDIGASLSSAISGGSLDISA